MTFVLLLVLATATPSAAPSPVPLAAPPASASPATTAVPTSVATAVVVPVKEDPAVTKRAREWFHRMQIGSVERSELSAQMSAALTDALVTKTAAQLAPLGEPTSFKYVKAYLVGDQLAYVYQVSVPSGSFYWWFGLDTKGQITGFYVRTEVPPN
jgi:hypothetical protein